MRGLRRLTTPRPCGCSPAAGSSPGSDPESEVAESDAKLVPMRDALTTTAPTTTSSPPADDRGRPRPRWGPERLAPRRRRPGAPTGGRRGLRPRRRPDPLGPGRGQSRLRWGTERATAFVADPDFDFAAWNHANDAGRTLDGGGAGRSRVAPALRARRSSPTASTSGPRSSGRSPGSVAILRELHDAPGAALRADQLVGRPVPRGARAVRLPRAVRGHHRVRRGRRGQARPGDLRGPGGARRPPRRPRRLHLHRRQPGQRGWPPPETGLDAVHFTGADHLREDLIARGMPLRHLP